MVMARVPSAWRTAAAAAAVCGCLGLTAQPASAGDGPAVVAHRGSSGMAPENTAAAIGLAIDQGADAVEIDVQRTRDGRLVSFHDCTLERTTNAEEVYPDRDSYRVSDFTWAQLRRLDAGSWFHEDYAGERIITVDEVISRVDGETGLLAEISPCAHDDGLAAGLAALLRDRPRYLRQALASHQLAVQSFKTDDARAFHRLMPRVPVGVLTAERPTGAELRDLAGWADQVNPRYTVTDRELVDRIHGLGMDVKVWTVDEPDVMRTMAGLGVDALITDFPQSMIQP